MPDPRLVREMFGRIAGRYDLLNHLLSAGVDRRWRRACVRAAGDVRGKLVVDACCGTGDLSLAFAGAGARAVGVDFVAPMLRHALPKQRESGAAALFAQGDALRLPIRSSSADLATVAFGIRNLADRGAGLAEMVRVVRPEGLVLVLEFSRPPNRLLGAFYGFYFGRVLPWIGGLISGDREAYRYLPRTVQAWPAPAQLQAEMENAGLVECGHRLLTGGIACLHWGRVGGEPP